MERFAGVPIAPEINTYIPFAAPTYVLLNSLQAGKRTGKWHEKARVGLYLGSSKRS